MIAEVLFFMVFIAMVFTISISVVSFNVIKDLWAERLNAKEVEDE